ncbi:MAG TPA: hypothetical protein VD996_14365 [Chitinophagaceae bacterium]|nr:hypothetical protein [Chitinophagaceae bacterium]
MKSLLAICLLCSACVFGQGRVNVTNDDINMQLGTFFQAVNGVPINTNSFYKVVEGSPFFKEHWMKGSASLGEDKEFHNLRLKVNLMDDKIHFMDAAGNEIICSTPINRVKVTDSLTGKEHRFVHSSTIPNTPEIRSVWLELVTDGKAQLYCHHKKNISETRPYGSATLEQRILTSDLYYVRVGDRTVRIKKLSDIYPLLTGQEEAAQQWAKKNARDNAAGYAKLVEWYNAQFR